MPGQVTALYCIVTHSTAVHWLYWVIRGRSLDNKDSGPGERGGKPSLCFSLARKRENLISSDNLQLSPLYSLQSLTTYYNNSP